MDSSVQTGSADASPGGPFREKYMRAAHRLAFVLGAAVTALAAACDGGPAERPAGIGAAPPMASPEADMSTGAAVAPRGFQTAGDAGSAPGTAVGTAVGTPVADSAAPQMLIRTGDASLEVPSLEPAVEAVRPLATTPWRASTPMRSASVSWLREFGSPNNPIYAYCMPC